MSKVKYVLIGCLVFLISLFLFNDRVEAKVSENSSFKIEVGSDKLPVYYSLESAVEGESTTVKERMHFLVTLTGVSDTSKSYRWTHQLCYKIVGGEEVCEVDVMGKDQEGDNGIDITSEGVYSYYFSDDDMAFYSDTLEFEYITFKNSFVSLEEGSSESFSLDDITFLSDEIDYKYVFDINISYAENEGRKYVKNYYSSDDDKVYVGATFLNNIGSSLSLDGAPTYKIVNEVCVGDNLCVSESFDKVNNEQIDITPYIGNITFYYSSDKLLYVNNEINYKFASYKTTLVCLTNCEGRRISSEIVINEDTYYFDYTDPVIDSSNTSIPVVEEYVKDVEIKISYNDSDSGIDSDLLYYSLAQSFYGDSCVWVTNTTSKPYENGVSFKIGEGLSGTWCFRYQTYDKNGNYYVSDYYVYKFDNSGPSMSLENSYDSSKYYNDVELSPVFSDVYVGVKETYYLWSREVISESDYYLVKENGALYSDGVNMDSLEDGSYYLYFLSYDNLDNYKFYDVGQFNLDTIGLSRSDIEFSVYDVSDDTYSSIGKIEIRVSEMANDEEFKCGFFNSSKVNISDLVFSCYNNQKMSIPTGLEGEYSLWVYVHDRASNYSLFSLMDNLKVDTRGPVVSSEILYDDDSYRLVNEIRLSLEDLSSVNVVKYGWFLTSVNVISSDLVNDYNEVINYPKDLYGEYKLYIRALDNLGNESFISLDKVFKIDTMKINISLVGEDTITILKGQNYRDLGAYAYKGQLGSTRDSEVTVSGEVDTSKAGIYYLTYESGEGDLLVKVTRKVVVKDDAWLVVTSISLFTLGLLFVCVRLFFRKNKEHV